MNDSKKNERGAVLALPWVDLAKAMSPFASTQDVATGEGAKTLAVKPKSPPGGAQPIDSSSYDVAFQRVTDRLFNGDRIDTKERLTAPILFAEILSLPAERRLETIQGEPRFHTYLLAEMLLESSREAWFDHPLKAIEGARLALAVAQRLDVAFYGSVLPRSLELKAHAYLGNAYRIRGSLADAYQAFQRVDALLEEGALNIYERAEVLSLKASLFKDLRQFADAGELLEEIEGVYRQAGDDHQVGRTQIQKAVVLGNQGRVLEAVDALRDAISLIDIRREPRVVVSAWITMSNFLVGEEQFDEAEEALRNVLDVTDRLSVARVRLVQGKIAAGREQLESAETKLIESQAIFTERGASFDAGLAALDLSLVYLRQGLVGRVRKMAEEILLVFRSHNLAPEIMAAMILFQHAAEREIATLGLVKEIVGYLERSRDFGSLKGFDSP